MTAILIAGWVSTLTLGVLLVVAQFGNQDLAAENRDLEAENRDLKRRHPDHGLELASTRHGLGGVVVRTSDERAREQARADAELAAMVAAEEAVVLAAAVAERAALKAKDCEPRRTIPENPHGCVVEDGRCLTASHDHVYVTSERLTSPGEPSDSAPDGGAI